MYTSMRVALIILGLLGTSVVFSDACSCMFDTPRVHFCRSELVIITKNLTFANRDEFRDTFNATISEILKPSPNVELSCKHITVGTSSQSSLCGISGALKTGQSWLLGGNFEDGKLHVSLCGLWANWERLNATERNEYRIIADEGCADLQQTQSSYSDE